MYLDKTLAQQIGSAKVLNRKVKSHIVLCVSVFAACSDSDDWLNCYYH